MTKAAICFLLICIWSGNASAQSAEPIVEGIVLGRGTNSCESYLIALKTDDPLVMMTLNGKQYPGVAHTYAQWLAGYLTATYTTKPMNVKITFNGLVQWVKKYCTEHPDNAIFQAANDYINSHT